MEYNNFVKFTSSLKLSIDAVTLLSKPYLSASCKCGANLLIEMDGGPSEEDIITFKSRITGRGSSGKNCEVRHLKGSERERVVSEIKKIGGVERFRTANAKRLLKRGGPRAPMHYGRGF